MAALSNGPMCTGPMIEVPTEVYRVVDDWDCVLTTLDPRKALLALMKQIEKHDVTSCWVDVEILK
jgi:hypothetical protein